MKEPQVTLAPVLTACGVPQEWASCFAHSGVAASSFVAPQNATILTPRMPMEKNKPPT